MIDIIATSSSRKAVRAQYSGHQRDFRILVESGLSRDPYIAVDKATGKSGSGDTEVAAIEDAWRSAKPENFWRTE